MTILPMLIIAAVVLPIAPVITAPAEAGTAHRVVFAVISDAPVDAANDWLCRGVAFDLEKRFGRLPNLEAADRLEMDAAIKSAAATESSRVHAVINKTGAKLVLYVSALGEGGNLTLRLNLWIADSQATPSALSSAAYRRVEHKGAREDLFKLVDQLVDDILPELARAGIDVGSPENVHGLKWWPCKSVAAYENLIRGMLSVQSGDVAQAKNQLLKTLAVGQDNWFANYFLGAVALREGDIAKAAEYCRKAIALNPEVYAGVYANLSYCYSAMGDDKQAQWAKAEFERRTGKLMPTRTVPGARP